MAIKATFQCYNEGDKDGKPFDKIFPNEKEMYNWWNSQDGHPWLSYRLIKTEIVK